MLIKNIISISLYNSIEIKFFGKLNIYTRGRGAGIQRTKKRIVRTSSRI